ncbi:hypothetical protein BKA69DRAFT_1067533 [Paraphysoderma sedebokerense]|nr:hypothetical protein BKA69DRAFT_1067533 [Paraphysoderma sedebokerense]
MAGIQTPPSAYSQVFNCSCSSSPSSGSLLPKSLWVKLAVGQPVKVPTENCDDIADLVDAIKHKLQNSLAKVDCNRIYLQLSEDTNPLDPALSMLELVQLPKFQNTSTAPLLAKVTASSGDFLFIFVC